MMKRQYGLVISLWFVFLGMGESFALTVPEQIRENKKSIASVQPQVEENQKRIDTIQRMLIPAGAVLPFNLDQCPDGWKEYTPAYGRFIRGIDKTGKVDSDGERKPGNLQEDQLKQTKFSDQSGKVTPYDSKSESLKNPIWISKAPDNTQLMYEEKIEAYNIGSGKETRPKNVALLYCEKQ